MINLNIENLLEIVHAKQVSMKTYNWSNDSTTFPQEIRKELNEVELEIAANRTCYLEDELGDVLWDYLNLLQGLENEGKINIETVFSRSLKNTEKDGMQSRQEALGKRLRKFKKRS